MEISQEQSKQLKKWAEEGLSLAIIQRKLSENWNLQLTYMEMRFLLDDLDIQLKEEESDDSKKQEAEGDQISEEQDALMGNQGQVSVALDKIVRPGALMSGSVTFSDGKKATWQLDSLGRLGIVPSAELGANYSPPEKDLVHFQKAIQTELQKSGLGY